MINGGQFEHLRRTVSDSTAVDQLCGPGADGDGRYRNRAAAYGW